MKQKLQEITDYKVMSFPEAANALGWKLTEDEDKIHCTCDCAESKITYSGFFGTEVVECESCGKRITDLFSPIQKDNSTCTVLMPSKFDIDKDENGYLRYWVAEDGKGGIKIK